VLAQEVVRSLAMAVLTLPAIRPRRRGMRREAAVVGWARKEQTLTLAIEPRNIGQATSLYMPSIRWPPAIDRLLKQASPLQASEEKKAGP